MRVRKARHPKISATTAGTQTTAPAANQNCLKGSSGASRRFLETFVEFEEHHEVGQWVLYCPRVPIMSKRYAQRIASQEKKALVPDSTIPVPHNKSTLNASTA